MIISNLPAPLDWNESRLNTFRKAFRFPAPLDTLAGWAGWGAEIRLDRLAPQTLQAGTLSIDPAGRLIWPITPVTLSALPTSTGYNLVLIAPDGTRKHYLTGRILLTT